MLPAKHKSDSELLEQIIDRQGVNSVLHMIETICSQKAEHVRIHWQDEPLAVAWEETANELSTMNLQENI